MRMYSTWMTSFVDQYCDVLSATESGTSAHMSMRHVDGLVQTSVLRRSRITQSTISAHSLKSCDIPRPLNPRISAHVMQMALSKRQCFGVVSSHHVHHFSSCEHILRCFLSHQVQNLSSYEHAPCTWLCPYINASAFSNSAVHNLSSCMPLSTAPTFRWSRNLLTLQ